MQARGRPQGGKHGRSVRTLLRYSDICVDPRCTGLVSGYRHYQEARRHALKLAFWPGLDGGGGLVEDLRWSWIDGMPEPRAAELRIHETIGGHDNLRIIFHVSKVILPQDPMPRIWTLAVMQKKTNRFEHDDLKTFRGRLTILLKRVYS